MNNCIVCGIYASNNDDRLCNNCREMQSLAERLIYKNPEKARVFFRDMVIKAGQTLRAQSTSQRPTM
jgi:hypothetical protein